MIKKFFDKYPHSLQRIFEIMPGFLLWVVLTSPLWMSIHWPILLGNLVIIFSVYWFYRGLQFVAGLIIGYRYYLRDIQIDWLDACHSLDFTTLPNPSSLPKATDLPKHLIVIPVGGSGYETLRATVLGLAEQNYPKELIYISISFEKRLVDTRVDYYEDTKRKLIQEFEPIFGSNLMFFYHPSDLPGEVIGAAANRTWGNRMAVELLEAKGERISDFLTTSPDEDLIFHKEYLGVVSYRYLINPKREKRFYQTAVYLFHNNYWKVPGIIRAWSMWLTLPVLSSSVTHLAKRETWSCYTLNLGLMKQVNYWDTSIGIDDTPFFWRPYDFLNGDFECDCFFVPLYADSVYHPNIKENLIALYKQLVRWGWGVVAFPIAMHVLVKNKNIPILNKIHRVMIMVELIALLRIASIIFTFAIPVSNLISVSSEAYAFSYQIPDTLSRVMTLLFILAFPALYYRFKLTPPKPDTWSNFRYWKVFIMDIAWQVVVLYTYTFFPFLVGPTKLMFGKKYGFLVTRKIKD